MRGFPWESQATHTTGWGEPRRVPTRSSHIPETDRRLGHVFSVRRRLAQVIEGPLSLRSVPSTFWSQVFLSRYLSFSGEIRDVTSYLKAPWGTSGKWGRGKKG